MRGRRIDQVLFVAAILAGGLLLAAHLPLHDYDLPGTQHAEQGHEPMEHQHPVRTLAIAVFSVMLIVVAVAVTANADLARSATDRSPARVGSLRCDDDIGLHALLSVYRI